MATLSMLHALYALLLGKRRYHYYFLNMNYCINYSTSCYTVFYIFKKKTFCFLSIIFFFSLQVSSNSTLIQSYCYTQQCKWHLTPFNLNPYKNPRTPRKHSCNPSTSRGLIDANISRPGLPGPTWGSASVRHQSSSNVHRGLSAGQKMLFLSVMIGFRLERWCGRFWRGSKLDS